MSKAAKGGVLFIDEAYELGKGPFGAEACTAIVAAMTDPKYRGRDQEVFQCITTMSFDVFCRRYDIYCTNGSYYLLQLYLLASTILEFHQ